MPETARHPFFATRLSNNNDNASSILVFFALGKGDLRERERDGVGIACATPPTRTRWIHDTLNACISFTFDFMLFGGCERRRQDGNGLTDVNNESEINVLNFPRAHNYLLFLLMFAVYASVRS